MLAAAVQAGTGLFSNNDIDFTGPLFSSVSEKTAALLTNFHKQSIYVLLALIDLHVLAIFWYVRIKKQNLLKPMLTGWKEVDQEVKPAAPGKTRWLALTVSLILAGLAVYVVNGAHLSHATAQETAQKKPAW
ncbi:cytochrome b/b6 domain-containing protein [Undibacterium sp. TJN19]|uniref:cytochrome b/b6 domain-containing protein n=1 Tax=Undibacterium sp. TJN19 TaxID=3413055 RepID=UPI003BF0472B